MAQKINGYNAADWKDAPDLRTVLQQYAALTVDAVLMAHNVTFEWMFLQPAFQDTGVENRMDYHRLCSASGAWFILHRNGLTKFSQDAVFF
ncbi:hypothetical protein [Pseudoalteromonas sp.]|uniref:hypothetical protein n=1 Tax=Pseudoalteromonas sp. TaxID=53249 RepID=UPI0035677592